MQTFGVPFGMAKSLAATDHRPANQWVIIMTFNVK